MPGTSFISTTIPYVNAEPHLGHALEYVQCDAFARHMRMAGTDTFVLSGSDENSLKNVLAAQQLGKSTRELVHQNVGKFTELIAALGVSLSSFIRTSVDQDHIAGVTEIWRRLNRADDIYTAEYEGLYCVGCEQFYTENELMTGLCPEHLSRPEVVREPNYYFRLSRYQDRIIEAIESGQIRITPKSRSNEVLSFVRSGLTDISISRSRTRARDWGIAVPNDPDQVIYVWLDALSNYVNALGWTRDDERYRRYWTDAGKRVHVVGKGVIRFHAVYWPAMLMAAGLPVPTDIVVHGYITLDGQKISKSLGHIVNPMELVDNYGVDALRYFLLADFAPFLDSDFNRQRLVTRYNGDLANGLGNLVSRATSMIVRYRDGVVPTIGPVRRPEQGLREQLTASKVAAIDAMNRYDHRESIARTWDLVRRTNAYLDERAPWRLAKAQDESDNRTLLDTTLHHVAGAVQELSAMIEAVLPGPAARIREALSSTDVTRGSAFPDLAGQVVTELKDLFPRIEKLISA